MSSTTPNLGLTKTTAAETIGQNWAASNDSGGNFDIIDTKMGAVGSQSVQAQLDALNSKLTPEGVTLTPATGVTIVTNRSYKIGKILVLCVKGYTTEAKSNGAKIFDLPATVLQNGIPFPIGVGVEWGITGTGYGYCRSNDIGATLSSGQYFHINATLVFA